MANLEEYDRSPKDLCKDPELKFEIAFSKWTKRQSPNIEQIIYYNGNENTTQVEYLKLIYCDKHDTEPVDEVKKHLVLFVKEIDGRTPDDFTQNLSIDLPLNRGDKIRCRVIVYDKTDHIPTLKEIDSTLYYKILDESPNAPGPVAPDTTDGEIIIKQ